MFVSDVLSDEIQWADEASTEGVMTSFKEYVLYVVDANDSLTQQLNSLHQKFDTASLQVKLNWIIEKVKIGLSKIARNGS